MNSFLFYLVESSVCLAIFYMVYWFLLRRDTFFLINRMYLLFVSILSMMIPLIPFRMIPGEAIYSAAILLDPVLITPAKIEHYANQHLQWSEIAFLIYITGVIIFLFRFLFQLFQLFFIIRRSGIKNRNDLKVVNVDRGYSPFSFFNFVFINDREIPDDSLETILTHERIHIQQCHTIDLILMETVIILQWFNPFAWFTGRSMKTIHEFLADEGVLREGINKWQYQQMILDETMGIQVNNLTNNFNISLLKKRIIMMTKSRSSFWAKSKLLFTLPAFIAVVLFFSIGSVYEAISINSPESGLKPENPVDQNQQTPNNKLLPTKKMSSSWWISNPNTRGARSRVKSLCRKISGTLKKL